MKNEMRCADVRLWRIVLIAGIFVTGATLVTPAAEAAPAFISCPTGDYENVDHACVHRPEQSQTQPDGATVQCRDGEYGFAQHRRGACSGHGGVDHWLASVPS
ncbi:DUF3761 domain-containing protein [Nocardia aurantia]|uniref:DUF3761 domain-containing protein n=1 Tax=Nocardia aurantia TaxID=2585199 RepID=A0A7K0E1K4_9NOCA|nr:DUF3761 domain-containing protein [Nocardia aurantia]MQY31966.1 hypothetical protein [Nocardia aurantia]